MFYGKVWIEVWGGVVNVLFGVGGDDERAGDFWNDGIVGVGGSYSLVEIWVWGIW